MRAYTLREVGRACQRFRQIYGHSQQDVANALNYSSMNISQFERGNNDSLMIFTWYLDNGFTLEFLDKFLKGEITDEYKTSVVARNTRPRNEE